VIPARLLSELEALAIRIGVALRIEQLGSELLGARGGLCRIRGQPTIVVDASLSVEDKVSVLAGALSTFDISAIYVPPAVRARIESAKTITLATSSAAARRPDDD
jgi:hypothetical protein